jgi:hypothetical protein
LQLSKAVQWLEKAPFECKIVIAGAPPFRLQPFEPLSNLAPGNHDLTLDRPFYDTNSPSSNNQVPQDPAKCLSLLTSSPSITYLSHSSARIRLTSPSGPRTTFTVFGSPYSPKQESGLWAFQYDRDSAQADGLWSQIPLDTDILVTHTPPYRHCDESTTRRRAMGCEVLRRAMWRVRPRVHVCGHVHEGRGAERVRWDLDAGGGNVRFKEERTESWVDGAMGGKMSLLDLTGRRGRTLDNDGGHSLKVRDNLQGSRGDEQEDDLGQGRRDEAGEDGLRDDHCCGLYVPRSLEGGEIPNEPLTPTGSASPEASPGVGTTGLGLSRNTDRSPARSDLRALTGRMSRRETCVVNCAITATNWPHTGGRRFNKPIVIDLDLPVWSFELERDDGVIDIGTRGQAALFLQ